MTIQQIASRLAELCKKGEFEEAQKELFSAGARSTEPFATPDFEKETVGLDNIYEKGRKFAAMVEEYHSIDVSEPLVVKNSFAMKLTMDITMKVHGRTQMSELCIYEIADGKIISESFLM